MMAINLPRAIIMVLLIPLLLGGPLCQLALCADISWSAPDPNNKPWSNPHPVVSSSVNDANIANDGASAGNITVIMEWSRINPITHDVEEQTTSATVTPSGNTNASQHKPTGTGWSLNQVKIRITNSNESAFGTVSTT